MSTTYSIGGYRIAIQARSAKTIVVEGKDDKGLLETLRQCWKSTKNIVIDSVDIVSDAAVSGLGAKAKVDFVINAIPSGIAQQGKFSGFVDREWEELINPTTSDPLPWSLPVSTTLRLKTPGHSIENFGFSKSFVEIYIKHFGSSIATPALLHDVDIALPEFIRAGAAFSEVARKRGLIGRCSNIFDLSDIIWNGSDVVLSQAIETRLQSRGGQNATGLINDFNLYYKGHWSQAPLAQEAEYHAHGHIGEALIWFGIAEIAVQHGFSTDICRELASGRKDEKRRVWHGWLCTLQPNALAPIDQVLS